jgi:hypothetical protein
VDVKEMERAVWFGFALPSVTKETERALETLGDEVGRGETREKSSHALDITPNDGEISVLQLHAVYLIGRVFNGCTPISVDYYSVD